VHQSSFSFFEGATGDDELLLVEGLPGPQK
jgi:hypothetical protein